MIDIPSLLIGFMLSSSEAFLLPFIIFLAVIVDLFCEPLWEPFVVKKWYTNINKLVICYSGPYG